MLFWSMTTLLLIRHADTAADPNTPVIWGRAPGIHLSAIGQKQAERLASCLVKNGIAALYSSPIERAVETASYIARGIGIRFDIAEGLNEVDYGRWAGRSYQELGEDDEWRIYNNCRSCSRIPGGESILEVTSRAVAEVGRLRSAHPGELIAAVSHADVIRALLAHFMGLPIDLALRLEISLASVSALRFYRGDLRVLLINGIGDEPVERA
jgi:broad specificity phosphatase PhoE